MSSQMSKAIRSIAMTIALLFIFLWICAPVAVALTSTNKVEIVDSQKDVFPCLVLLQLGGILCDIDDTCFSYLEKDK